MSVDKLKMALQQLNTLHQHLLTIGYEKTDIIKYSKVDDLKSLMMQEQKYVLAIKQIEEERESFVTELLQGYPKEEQTLLKCVEVFDEPKLLEIGEKLIETISKLKEVNHLNQQLVNQSLQFVNVSLDLLRPQPESVTYDNPNKTKQQSQNRSMFDSKA